MANQPRRRGRPRKTPLPRPRLQSQSVPLDQVTGTGAPLEENQARDEWEMALERGDPEALRQEAESRDFWQPANDAVDRDFPPANKARGRPKAASKQQRVWETLVSYYTLGGLAVSRINQGDGQVVVAHAQDCADAWIAAGRANPQIMQALEMVTIAGPYMALITVHASLVITIMDRHGANPVKSLFGKAPTAGEEPAPPRGATPEPPPLPYVPVGPTAPTEAMPSPPPYVDEGVRIVPDEGLPADVDVALRQMARQTGRPYEELRQEAMVALAQQRMAANGRLTHPGTLGAPVMKE